MVWLIVLSGYPKSGKTTISKKLTKSIEKCARIGSDNLRDMLFGEVYPCRDELLIWELIKELSIKLQKKGYSVIIDSTAPGNDLRRKLLEVAIDRKLLLVVRASEEAIRARGGSELLTTWKRFWEEPEVEADIILDERCEEPEDIERIVDKLKMIITSENSIKTSNDNL